MVFNQGTTDTGYQGQGENIVQISSTTFVDDVNTHHAGCKTIKLMA
jgi:hypothetical protein